MGVGTSQVPHGFLWAGTHPLSIGQDRIDYNVEQTKEQTSQAVVELKQVQAAFCPPRGHGGGLSNNMR